MARPPERHQCGVLGDGRRPAPPRRRQLGPDGASAGPAYRQLLSIVHTRHMPQAVANITDSLAMGMDAGILVIRAGRRPEAARAPIGTQGPGQYGGKRNGTRAVG